MLKHSNKMTLHNIARAYIELQPEVFWEDFLLILEENFGNRRLAYALRRQYITGKSFVPIIGATHCLHVYFSLFNSAGNIKLQISY